MSSRDGNRERVAEPGALPVGLVYGFWGQNIGNAFFNLGGAYALQSSLPRTRRLVHLQDQPAYWTFRNESKGNYSRAFSLAARAKCSPLVLQGPIFTPNFGSIWKDPLCERRQRGYEWGAIGVGLRKYSDEERDQVAAILKDYPPRFLATRDRPTFDFLDGLRLPGVALHDGIDSGFYCALAYNPPKVDVTRPLICMTFDHFSEPYLELDSAGPVIVDGRAYRLRHPVLQDKLARLGKAAGIAGHMLPSRRARPIDAFKGTVVRPTHRTNPHIPRVIYRRNNGIASDEPYTYLALYRSADLTISDRVHACVATLAYGGRAIFHNPVTKRSALFDRVGCHNIRKRPVSLDRSFIADEFDQLQAFLRHVMRSGRIQ